MSQSETTRAAILAFKRRHFAFTPHSTGFEVFEAAVGEPPSPITASIYFVHITIQLVCDRDKEARHNALCSRTPHTKELRHCCDRYDIPHKALIDFELDLFSLFSRSTTHDTMAISISTCTVLSSLPSPILLSIRSIFGTHSSTSFRSRLNN